MNKIVANPKLINDDTKLNQRIEQIFNLDAFQKMVENADIFQDLSTSSVFSTSKILDKSVRSYQSKMESMMKDQSMGEISVEGSQGIDNRMLIQHESGLKSSTKKQLQSDKKSENLEKVDKSEKLEKHEKVRNENVHRKSRKEEKEIAIKNEKDEDTHKTSHDQKAPMKNRETEKEEEDIEESQKFSEKIIKELHEHESPSQKSDNNTNELVDEYENDEDPGFLSIDVLKEDMEEKCLEISEKYGFPELAFRPNTEEELIKMKKKELKKALSITQNSFK